MNAPHSYVRATGLSRYEIEVLVMAESAAAHGVLRLGKLTIHQVIFGRDANPGTQRERIEQACRKLAARGLIWSGKAVPDDGWRAARKCNCVSITPAGREQVRRLLEPQAPKREPANCQGNCRSCKRTEACPYDDDFVGRGSRTSCEFYQTKETK